MSATSGRPKHRQSTRKAQSVLEAEPGHIHCCSGNHNINSPDWKYRCRKPKCYLLTSAKHSIIDQVVNNSARVTISNHQDT